MKLLLIYPDIIPSLQDWSGYYYQGVASLAASMRAAGHEIHFVHLTQRPRRQKFLEQVRAVGPDLVTFSSTTNQFAHVLRLSQWIRNAHPNLLQVVGGVHAILNAEQVLEEATVDFVCRCEGEYALAELSGVLSGESSAGFGKLRGFWWRDKAGQVRRTPMPEPIGDLDGLPLAARDIFDYPNLFNERRGFAVVMASRGCPFRCTYCCNAAIRKVFRESGKHRYVRFRSVANFIGELKTIRQNYPWVRGFAVDDDILFLHKAWSQEFTKKYRQDVGLPFICNMHPLLLDEERVGWLAEAGCCEVRIGLESGNQAMRVEVLGRPISDKQLVRAYALCREAGIRTRSFVMTGLPGETPAKALDSVHMVAFNKVDLVQVSVFYPYRGTVLYERVKAEGSLSSRQLGDYMSESVLELPGYSREQIRVFRCFFYPFVYLYRALNVLPQPLKNPAIRFCDRFLCTRVCSAFLAPLIPVVDFFMSVRRYVKRVLARKRVRVAGTSAEGAVCSE